MSHHNKVHPDLLIARSRRWTRSAIAATGAATLGLTGWIAFSSETASAKTAQSTNGTTTTNATTHKAHHKKKVAAASNAGSSNYTPTTSTNSSTPVQGTTSGS